MSFDLTPGLSSFTDATFTSDQTTRICTNAFARIRVTTTATSVDVTAYCNNANQFGWNSIGLYIDGAYVSQTVFAATGLTTQTIALTGTGTRTIDLINGATDQASGAGIASMVGCWMTLLSFNAAFTQVFPTSSNKLVIYGDSISQTQKATPSHQNGYGPLVRVGYTTGQVAFEGGNGGSVRYDNTNGTRLSALTARMVAAAPSLIWLAMGTNDTSNDTVFNTDYTAIVDAINVALPSCKMVAMTMFTRGDGAEAVTEGHRVKMREMVAARTSFMTLAEGPRICNGTTDLNADGIHLVTAGHAKVATYILNYLSGIRRYRLTTS